MPSSVSTVALTSRERRAFILRRLHSLSGAVPLGAFLIVHLWTTSQAMAGKEAFEEAIGLEDAPLTLCLEVLFIYVPLIFHAGYGIKLMLDGRPNPVRYSLAKNWGYLMQRVTGIIALLFIIYHTWQFRAQVLLGRMDKADLFGELCAALSSTVWGGIPLVAFAYLVGVAACAFHFSNGLYGFCFSWGVTLSERATRLASTAFGVLGLGLFLGGALTVIYCATGSVPFLTGNGAAERNTSQTAQHPAVAARLRATPVTHHAGAG